MTSLIDLEEAYKKHLKNNLPVSSSGQANDAFEVYAFSLVLQAARQEGAIIYFKTVKGSTNPSKLIFRTSPGRIYSQADDYAYALITFNNELHFEAHVGVYVEGLAGVVHECDVLVIDAGEGDFCRRNSVHPKKTHTILTAECKFYSGNLGISLGREFLGTTIDLGKEDRFFLSNRDGKTLDRVLAHHKRQRYLGLTPLNPDTESQTISQFRTAFRNQISKKR
ncbi:hypothetical protein PSR30_01205 [Pectobacterium carotovorum subsp. carotovorum]|uniref:hypothetical protein n=1 Tax=Pectobacterium carotovorum TaxID=554 RepID=UPI0023672A3B|nr:hypothetical protein [Pectobacterium carotovorum]WDF99216.1 hypothetical protein PSR30_01205 [Pectobacterium carotovorum subsp. carotovorum]